MKKLKYALLVCFGSFALTSCIVDDENREEYLAETPAIYGFKDDQSVNVFLPTDTDVVPGEAFVTRQSADNGNLTAQSFRYSLDATNPALTILNTSDVLTVNANGTVSTPLQYEVDPNLLSIGDNITITVTATPLDATTLALNDTFEIVLQKCDPILTGTYINGPGSNYGGAGETVEITPNDCDGSYTASNMPAFNGTFFWDFVIDDATGAITIDTTLANFPNTVTGEGQYNSTNGTISFTNVAISGTTVSGYNFTLIP